MTTLDQAEAQEEVEEETEMQVSGHQTQPTLATPATEACPMEVTICEQASTSDNIKVIHRSTEHC